MSGSKRRQKIVAPTCPACGSTIAGSGIHRSELTTAEVTKKRKVSCPDCGFGPFTWSPWDELNRVTCPSCGNENAQRTTLPEKARCEACGYGVPEASKWEKRLGPLVFLGIPGVVLLVLFGFLALFRGIPPPSVAYQRGEPVEVRNVDCVAESWSPRRGLSGSCTATWSTADGQTRSGGIYGADFEHGYAEPDTLGTLEARAYDGLAYLEVGGSDVAMDVILLLVPLVIGGLLVLAAVAWSLRSFFSSSPRASPPAPVDERLPTS